ncbi:hypothetical protein ACFWNG_18370 [Streptomyces sp. NPDC058391]|uniref:hypothetical protein n=1 Tax=Streptomyces sp. NPDC058391 TaxID=3346476 RepID=UPI003666C214
MAGRLRLGGRERRDRAQDLVRMCVIEDRAAGTPWEQIAELFGISADAARKRWGHWELAQREEL